MSLGSGFLPTQIDCVNPECKTSLGLEELVFTLSKVQNMNLI